MTGYEKSQYQYLKWGSFFLSFFDTLITKQQKALQKSDIVRCVVVQMLQVCVVFLLRLLLLSNPSKKIVEKRIEAQLAILLARN